MIHKLLLLLSMVINIIACKSDDDTMMYPVTSPLTGTWNLVAISCECEPVFLNKEAHQWVFDIDASEIKITNNVRTPSDLLLDSGVYESVFTDNTVTVDEITYDYYFEDNKLFLAYFPEVDGPLITFVK